LNAGHSGREIFLLYKREEGQPAVTQISVYLNTGDEPPPPSYIPLEYTVSGRFLADLNTGSNGAPLFFCFKKETDEDTFLQVELGWVPQQGFKKEKMSQPWHKFLEGVGISDSDLLYNAPDVRFAVEETLIFYNQLLDTRKGCANVTSCFCCSQSFEYPDGTDKVICPFCQTTNQCTFAGPQPLPYVPSYATFGKTVPTTPTPVYTPSYVSYLGTPANAPAAPAYMTGISYSTLLTPSLLTSSPGSLTPNVPSAPQDIPYSYGDIPLGVPKVRSHSIPCTPSHSLRNWKMAPKGRRAL
jgi:LSD1 subclass zinc finger protein